MKQLQKIEERLAAWGKNIWADDKKRVNLVVCIGLAGLLLLVGSEWIPDEADDTATPVEIVQEETEQTEYVQKMEQQLEELLARMEGVGRAKVMVTLENGQENVYATDSETHADGTTATDHVLVDQDGLLETIRLPHVLGVAVVCEGGDNVQIQSRVTTLVAALTGAGANHITVTKMASTQKGESP